MDIDTAAFTIDCTGDACTGDVVLFTEAAFGGSYRRAKFLGERRIVAEVISDSYGGEKQQHTFSLEVIDSDGYDPLAPGSKIRRKGRNVYRNGTRRQRWPDEAERKETLDDKHERGAVARAERAERLAHEEFP